MAKRHLIALDLDGTLLLKNQEISPRTKTALMKAKKGSCYRHCDRPPLSGKQTLLSRITANDADHQF